MTDVTFRSANESVEEVQPIEPIKNGPTIQRGVKVEPAYTLYESANNGRTYIEEYFGIEDRWDDNEVDGREVDKINEYFKEKIEKGDIANTTEAVKTLLKKYQKRIEDWNESDRLVVKIQKLIAYLDLKKAIDDINKNNRIYGSK